MDQLVVMMYYTGIYTYKKHITLSVIHKVFGVHVLCTKHFNFCTYTKILLVVYVNIQELDMGATR